MGPNRKRYFLWTGLCMLSQPRGRWKSSRYCKLLAQEIVCRFGPRIHVSSKTQWQSTVPHPTMGRQVFPGAMARESEPATETLSKTGWGRCRHEGLAYTPSAVCAHTQFEGCEGTVPQIDSSGFLGDLGGKLPFR